MTLTQFILIAIGITALGVLFLFGLVQLEDRLPRVFSHRTGALIVLGLGIGGLVWQVQAPEWLGSPWWLAMLIAYWTGQRVGRGHRTPTAKQEVAS